MSMRELAVFIEQLPMSSRTKQRLAGNDSGRHWGEETHLLADIVNILQAQTRLFYSANFDGKPPKMDLVDRPTYGDGEVDRPTIDPRVVEYLNSYK